MQIYKLILCCSFIFLCCHLSFGQEAKAFIISVDFSFLPSANYEAYTYKVCPKTRKVKLRQVKSVDHGNREEQVKSKFKLSDESLEQFIKFLKEELVDSTSISLSDTLHLVDSVFRKPMKGRDLSSIAAQLDGPFISVRIQSQEKNKKQLTTLYELGTDLTVGRIRRDQNEIKWLKINKILTPILSAIKNELLQNYFLKSSIKSDLLRIYKKKQ